MEEGLNHLISLIEQSLDLESPEDLKHIEVEIKTKFENIKTYILDQIENNHKVDEEKIKKLSFLLDKLNQKHIAQKNFLSEFSDFLKNRKIN